uniref:Uncharacterized protein n=1 Tax=Aegilops tauschii subsp. strangulata TaxID=200361 RepID=A0A453I978_AEGTS
LTLAPSSPPSRSPPQGLPRRSSPPSPTRSLAGRRISSAHGFRRNASGPPPLLFSSQIPIWSRRDRGGHKRRRWHGMIETPPLLTSSHIWVVEPTGMREEAAAAGAVLANASSSHNRRQCWRIGCPWCVNHERCRRKNHVDKSTHTHQVQVAVTVSHHPRSRFSFCTSIFSATLHLSDLQLHMMHMW